MMKWTSSASERAAGRFGEGLIPEPFTWCNFVDSSLRFMVC